MRLGKSPFGFLAIICGLAVSAPAWALSPQTWVSTNGTDAGTCPITSPCKTFQYALSKTSVRGVINVLSSGDFGPVTINKSVSIVSDGAEGAIYSQSGGAAVKIQGANTEVILRGLTIDLFGAPNTGVLFLGGVALHVHNCTIRGTADGISFQPSTGATSLEVSGSLITNAVSDGIVVFPSSGASVKVGITRTHVKKSGGNGIAFIGLFGGINATVSQSVSSSNAQTGIWASGNSGSPLNVMIDQTVSINNGSIGVHTDGGTFRMGNSTVSGNNTGLSVTSGGTLNSYGNNKVNGNFPGGDGAPSGLIAFQ